MMRLDGVWFEVDLCTFSGYIRTMISLFQRELTSRAYSRNFICERISECHSLPCMNGGACTVSRGTGRPECACPSGTTGTHCETSSLKCENGGTVSLINLFSVCVCPDEWTGEVCESDVDECSSGTDNCTRGNQVCRNTMPGFACFCTDGWTGFNCESPVNSGCRNSSCLNGGFCSSTGCTCVHGYGGNYCQTDIRCAFDECKNGGQCMKTATGFTCQCGEGYTGEFCETDIDECDKPVACSLDTPECFNYLGHFSCCEAGYAGVDCQEDIDECDNPQSCHGLGGCVNTVGGFRCICRDGFDSSWFCAAECPDETIGVAPVITEAPPTAIGTPITASEALPTAIATPTAATQAPTSATQAPTAATQVPPVAEGRADAAGGDGGTSGVSQVLDYWYYFVPILGLLLAVLVAAVFCNSNSKLDKINEEQINEDKQSPSVSDSEYSVDSDESNENKKLSIASSDAVYDSSSAASSGVF